MRPQKGLTHFSAGTVNAAPPRRSVSARKTDALPRPWPTLTESQDPDGLPARVAFHLHRLGYSATALTDAGVPRRLARELRRGSLPEQQIDAAWLCHKIGLQRGESLARPLYQFERLEWDFYRVSARNVTQVWLNAANAWRPQMSTSQAAKLLGFRRNHVAAVVAGTTQSPVLTWPAAEKLAGALQIQAGAKAFLEGLPPHPPYQNERV